jgi:hypothetical protein
MGEQPPGPQTIYTVQVKYKKNQMMFLFLIEASSEEEALATFRTQGYSLDRKLFDVSVAKATLLECNDFRSSTHSSSPIWHPRRQIATTG